MKFDVYEIKKIFDYYLNKNTVLDNNIFGKDFLIMIEKIIDGNTMNNFVLSKEQKNYLISLFLNGSCGFDEKTPKIILENKYCITEALKRDINSINYIKTFPFSPQKLLDIALKQNYILSSNSPFLLKSDFKIALNSIRHDIKSVDFINIDSFNDNEVNTIIDEIIRNKYLLSSSSPNFLKSNCKVVLNSIKSDIETIKYAQKDTLKDPDIFRYLALNNYDFSNKELKEMPLSTFKYIESIKYSFLKLDMFGIYDDNENNDLNYDDLYIDRFCKFCFNVINTLPRISNLSYILHLYSDRAWSEYKRDNIDNYTNIFGKICSELKKNSDYEKAITKLHFLDLMKESLGDDYNLLLHAMVNYHTFFHNNDLDNLALSRDEISKYSALYISKSKEKFKKDLFDNFMSDIKEFFVLVEKDPIIYKKIIEKKQREKLKTLYLNGDIEIKKYTDSLLSQYSNDKEKDLIKCMIDNFLINGYTKISSFITEPSRFNDYIKMKNAKKLVNRLNKNYIKYNDNDVLNYLDVIKYDSINEKYCYIGPSFNEEEIILYNDYENKINIFDKIKWQLIQKSKDLKVQSKISREEIKKLKDSIPFNDNFFEFDKKILDSISLQDFINYFEFEYYLIDDNTINDNEAYSFLNDYITKNGVMWLWILADRCNEWILTLTDTDRYNILDSFDHMDGIVRISKLLNYNMDKYEDVITLIELCKYSNEMDIAILGKELILKLCKYQEFTSYELDKTIKIAKDIACQMVKKDKSTVPYVSGTFNNYSYSVYDSQDESVLSSGIDTNACFRINGLDNDFLHYCVLNKNGVIIKIEDPTGNFIARASGFRNGNFIYFNQLRTVYDGNGKYNGDLECEKKEIIDVFKEACDSIIRSSFSNKKEINKIKYIFATKSYILSDTSFPIVSYVRSRIGKDPVYKNCTDWELFVANTKNLQSVKKANDFFETDYDTYKIICISSTNSNKFLDILNFINVKPGDADAVYPRPRNKIVVTTDVDEKIISKINKINALYCYFNNKIFEYVKVPSGFKIYLGDNWYIICDNGFIVDSIVLDFDKNAILEYEEVKNNILCSYSNEKEKIKRLTV